MNKLLDPKNRVGDELKLCQITQLFLNSFKSSKDEQHQAETEQTTRLVTMETTPAPTRINKQKQSSPHSPKSANVLQQDVQLETAFRTASRFLAIKS